MAMAGRRQALPVRDHHGPALRHPRQGGDTPGTTHGIITNTDPHERLELHHRAGRHRNLTRCPAPSHTGRPPLSHWDWPPQPSPLVIGCEVPTPGATRRAGFARMGMACPVPPVRCTNATWIRCGQRLPRPVRCPDRLRGERTCDGDAGGLVRRTCRFASASDCCAGRGHQEAGASAAAGPEGPWPSGWPDRRGVGTKDGARAVRVAGADGQGGQPTRAEGLGTQICHGDCAVAGVARDGDWAERFPDLPDDDLGDGLREEGSSGAGRVPGVHGQGRHQDAQGILPGVPESEPVGEFPGVPFLTSEHVPAGVLQRGAGVPRHAAGPLGLRLARVSRVRADAPQGCGSPVEGGRNGRRHQVPGLRGLVAQRRPVDRRRWRVAIEGQHVRSVDLNRLDPDPALAHELVFAGIAGVRR